MIGMKCKVWSVLEVEKVASFIDNVIVETKTENGHDEIVEEVVWKVCRWWIVYDNYPKCGYKLSKVLIKLNAYLQSCGWNSGQ